eukprot:4604674-Prymnesium_polylepis.1
MGSEGKEGGAEGKGRGNARRPPERAGQHRLRWDNRPGPQCTDSYLSSAERVGLGVSCACG